jgi:hypothetical protein
MISIIYSIYFLLQIINRKNVCLNTKNLHQMGYVFGIKSGIIFLFFL